MEKLLSEFNDICITEAGNRSERFVEALSSHSSHFILRRIKGLNQNIRLSVKAYRCAILENAISAACVYCVEEALSERFANFNKSSEKIILKCQFCKTNGHSADKCLAIPGNKVENKSNLNPNIEVA